MPFKFSPGHCGTGPCGCDEECTGGCGACCFDPEGQAVNAYIDNVLTGPFDTSALPGLFDCVYGTCLGHDEGSDPGAINKSISVTVDFGTEPPTLSLIGFGDNAGCNFFGEDIAECNYPGGLELDAEASGCTKSPFSASYKYDVTEAGCPGLYAQGFRSITIEAS